MNELQHCIILTPGIAGADGVSACARLVVSALQAHGPHGPTIDIVSLTESQTPPMLVDKAGLSFAGANGSKARFAAHMLRAIRHARPRAQVICVHLHLSPLGVPLSWRGAQLLTILHGIEAWKPLHGVQRWALRRSRFMANSAYTALRFRAANPWFVDHPVSVCHLGVPAAAARAGAVPCAVRRQPWDDGAPFALIVGRMAADERYKGHDLLLEIWPRVIAGAPDARLVVAGDGDDRPRLVARARALGLEDRVAFLGRVPDEIVVQLYEACAFFVMPSREEGFGLVFLEAMRAGKACVGAPGAAAEIIQDGVTGVLVDPVQPDQVLSAVLRLFRQPQARDRMGRAGAVRYATEFTETSFQQRFTRLLRPDICNAGDGLGGR